MEITRARKRIKNKCKYYELYVNTINFLLSSIYITHISYVSFTNFVLTIYILELLLSSLYLWVFLSLSGGFSKFAVLQSGNCNDTLKSYHNTDIHLKLFWKFGKIINKIVDKCTCDDRWSPSSKTVHLEIICYYYLVSLPGLIDESISMNEKLIQFL